MNRPQNASSLDPNGESLNFQAPVRGKVLTLDICQGLLVSYPGDSAAHTLELGPVLHNVGQALEDIVAHLNIEDKTTGFQVNVKLTKSFDGKNFVDVGSFWLNPVTTAGYSISSAFSTRSDFGLHMGVRLIIPNLGASVESARVSLKLALRFAT